MKNSTSLHVDMIKASSSSNGNIPVNFPPIYSLDREMQLDLPLSGAFLKKGNHFLR